MFQSLSSKRRFAVLATTAALALGLAACSPSTDGSGTTGDDNAVPDKVSMHVYPGALLSLPTYVAEAEGIFAKYNLEVEQVSFSSGPEAVQALVSNGVNFVDTSPSVVNITNENFASSGSSNHISAVVGGVANGIHYAIVGAPTVDWPDTSDIDAVLQSLEGKTVGVTVVGADTQNIFVGLMEIMGYDASSVNFVGVGIGASAVAAVTTGQVDALVSAPPAGERIVDEGGTILVDFRDGGINDAFEPFMQTTYFGSDAWLEDNEDVAHRMQQAFAESMDFMADPANLDTVTEIFVGASEGGDFDTARPWVERYIPLFSADMSCAAVQNINDFYITYTDTFKEPVACDDYFWSGASDYVKG